MDVEDIEVGVMSIDHHPKWGGLEKYSISSRSFAVVTDEELSDWRVENRYCDWTTNFNIVNVKYGNYNIIY